MPTQAEERTRFLNLVLDSTSEKKLIVAGPGTGKTHTFKEILKKKGQGNYLILSFIRKLIDELALEIGDKADVKTFHAFCKQILHEVQGIVDIYPKLPQIIQKDAELLGFTYSNFETKFRNLQEDAPEIKFFLNRGDYYKHLSFDDSVYRLYKLLKEDNTILEEYDQIIVDEYQDFNKLEVEFLKGLEKKGPMLIVGDDDQAIYEGRSSSPDYLRERYNSKEFEVFELPYCSRCPKVIVDATNAFIVNVKKGGGFRQRLEKQYTSFELGKEELNKLYPKIKIITVPLIKTVAKYIDKEIKKIPKSEIIESNSKEGKYPTVLIIGQKHYLAELQKKLVEVYPNIEFEKKSKEDNSEVLDAIIMLLKDEKSNLGWRILTEQLQSPLVLRSSVLKAQTTSPFKEVLSDQFIKGLLNIFAIIKVVKLESREFTLKEKKELKTILKNSADEIISFFTPKPPQEITKENVEVPTILLRTFEGSKGLSGGHVFIVSTNNGSIPKIELDGNIKDIEYCKFIVALTRTRKLCHIISNKWFASPMDSNKKWLTPNIRSEFIDKIPGDYKEDLGIKKASEI